MVIRLSSFCSPLNQTDNCFDRKPIYYQHTVRYIDAITTQAFDHDTPFFCIIAICDEHYSLTPERVLRPIQQPLDQKQVQSAMSSNTFTAEEAGNHSDAYLTLFGNRVLFKQTSGTTMELLG